MLEAIREHAQGKFAKIVLALVTVPFALWGVESYLKNGSEGPIAAKVGDAKISQQEFVRILKQEVDRRGREGQGYDSTLLDQPEFRLSVLQGLINRQLVLNDMAREGVAVPNAELRKSIEESPRFQENGAFSPARYEEYLSREGINDAGARRRFRQDSMVQLALQGIRVSAMLPKSVTDRLIRLGEQQREVSLAVVPIEKFLPQTKVDRAMVKDYYDKHQSEFKVPEQARVEYVVLSADAIAQQQNVSDEEIAKYYGENTAQFGQPEERKASHILIRLAPDAGEAERKAASDKAQKIWAEAKAHPDDFARLAKEDSQDPGSASNGGDLGFFARSAMVKPFADKAFSMKVGEIGEPVRSDFGYHIIKLTDIKPGSVKPLAEVRAQIADTLRKQKGTKKFNESAENFGNVVYEQSDSLKPAAQQFGLSVQQSAWTSRLASDTPLLNNPKMLQAIFSDDVLKDKRNTEAIEVAPNVLVAARLLEYKPASVKPLAEVSTALEQRLQRRQAVELAGKWGMEVLADLRRGKEPAGIAWGAPEVVGRSHPGDVEPGVLKEAFKVVGDKLPGYAGTENAKGGYTLVKVMRVIEAAAPDDKTAQNFDRRVDGALENEYVEAYLQSLKQQSKIDIKKEALEKGEH